MTHPNAAELNQRSLSDPVPLRRKSLPSSSPFPVASLEKSPSSTDGQHYNGILFFSHVNLELIEASRLFGGTRWQTRWPQNHLWLREDASEGPVGTFRWATPGARCTSTDEDLEGRLCHCPPQGSVTWRAWLTPSLWFPPLERDRENGEWVSNTKFPAEELGKKLPTGPVCKLRGLHSKLSRGISWLTPESSVMTQSCNLPRDRHSEEHALSGEELPAWT